MALNHLKVCILASCLLLSTISSVMGFEEGKINRGVNQRSIDIPSGGDPNGPHRGGLDDPTDWSYLASAVFAIFNLLKMLYRTTPVEYIEDLKQSLKEGNYFNVTIDLSGLTGYAVISISIVIFTLEAFDVLDCDRDGC